jgi:hypothetical protein
VLGRACRPLEWQQTPEICRAKNRPAGCWQACELVSKPASC